MMMSKDKWKLAGTVAVPLIGGTIVGTLANKASKHIYKKLDTPDFPRTGSVFPIEWTNLYTTMRIEKYKFDKTPKDPNIQTSGSTTYITQLCFNFMWSFLFFKWNLLETALVD